MCACNQGMALSGYGLGALGDCIDPSAPTYNPNDCIVPTDMSGSGTPVYVPTPAPAPNPLWGNLLQQWTNISGKILTSAAGANPTYQATGSGGTVTYYGSPTSMPGLPANLMTGPQGTILGIPILWWGIGIVGLVAISSMGGRRR